MAQSSKTGNSIVTADDPITDLLAAPLRPDWTIDQLAEEVIRVIAARASDESQELVLDAQTTTDRQPRRLLRPLLACLAIKSADEEGTSPEIYGGRLSFKRPGREGSVWVVGQFENKPGAAWVAFRLNALPTRNSELTIGPSLGSR
jgi:hypothetical protein